MCCSPFHQSHAGPAHYTHLFNAGLAQEYAHRMPAFEMQALPATPLSCVCFLVSHFSVHYRYNLHFWVGLVKLLDLCIYLTESNYSENLVPCKRLLTSETSLFVLGVLYFLCFSDLQSEELRSCSAASWPHTPDHSSCLVTCE